MAQLALPNDLHPIDPAHERAVRELFARAGQTDLLEMLFDEPTGPPQTPLALAERPPAVRAVRQCGWCGVDIRWPRIRYCKLEHYTLGRARRERDAKRRRLRNEEYREAQRVQAAERQRQSTMPAAWARYEAANLRAAREYAENPQTTPWPAGFEVDCPSCGEPVGWPCFSNSGIERTMVHKNRKALASRA